MPEIALASVNISSRRKDVILLDSGHIQLLDLNSHFALIKKSVIIETEAYWNAKNSSKFKLVSLRNGKKVDFIPAQLQKNNTDGKISTQVNFSPDGKFIIWRDSKTSQLFIYDIANRHFKPLVGRSTAEEISGVESHSKYYQVLLWTKNDEDVIVSDGFDLWQVNPKTTSLNICLTGGIGRRNSLIFTPEELDVSSPQNGRTILLQVFSEANKQNGIASVKLGAPNSLTIKMLGPYLFTARIPDNSFKLRWSENRKQFLVPRQDASSSPNLYVSSDFKKFHSITNIHPEKEFNWITSELVDLKLNDGTIGKGILYKPENFHPDKKYPIIFNFYQERSDELHLFHQPSIYSENLLISWYVSNGYIVFVPDIINEKPGRIAETTLKVINSAVNQLSKNAWLDTTKMGLQGHSFGGFETELIISHSKRFAAAQAGAARSDGIGGPLGLAFGRSAFAYYEKGQFNFNATLWEKPDIYIQNSPVLYANNITTPLLIVHNENDDVVPYSHALAMFYSLRRLGKPAWLLNYKTSGHSVEGAENCVDFIIRQQQFFDHYLKGKPKPAWMIDGSLSLKLDSKVTNKN